METIGPTPAATFLHFLSQLRKSLRTLLLSLVGGSIFLFFLAQNLLEAIQNHLNQPLAYFTVTEPFLSLAKLAFLGACFTLMPLILYCCWKAAALPFALPGRHVFSFTLSTCVLFYIGATFCYFVTLPFGVSFLLGFQSEQLQPVISMGRFVSFVTMFLLAFGVIFQLPVFMVFTARVGICPGSSFAKNRRYALLIISILAALLTPTPDIINMMLMGLPLYCLYELGILLLKVMKL
jgi:sec-independent protein translocase protein TatC